AAAGPRRCGAVPVRRTPIRPGEVVDLTGLRPPDARALRVEVGRELLVMVEPPVGGGGEEEELNPLPAEGLDVSDRFRAVGRVVTGVAPALAGREVPAGPPVQGEQRVVALAD